MSGGGGGATVAPSRPIAPTPTAACMRLTVLAWSAAGGALLGLFAGLALFAVGALVVALLPEAPARWADRHWWAGALVCFVALPIAGGVVGYLEGRLKL